MPATYTTSLRLTKPADGDINWGQTVNTGITELVDASVAGTTTITMTAADYTLSNANGATDEARRMFIVATGSPGAPRNVICPAVSKLYFFRNDTAFALTLKTSAGSGVSVPAGQYQIVYCNGTDVVEAVNAFGSLTTGTLTAASLSLATPLAATSGGTGQSSYAVGDLIYASTTTALSKLADVATGNALISGGVGVAPSYGKIGLTTHVSGTLPIANGGTGLTTIAARSIFLANTANTLTTLTPAALQSIRINSGNTAWEVYTPVGIDVNNAFTGANTFYNATGQTFGTATATQDGIILAGRAGGTSTFRVTLSPGTLTASRSVTFPDSAGNVVIDAAANVFKNASGQTFLASSTTTQDGIVVTGRAGGSSTFRVTLSPTTLTASRAVTFPDAAGAVVIDTAAQTLTNKTLSGPTINDGYTEEVFAVSGTTPALSPTNGSIQTWTLSGNSTPTAGTWEDGQSLTLMIDDGTARTITWTSLSVTWKTNLGAAPTLNLTGFTAIQLWKVGAVIYGARVGDA